jgi:hypothetical protein
VAEICVQIQPHRIASFDEGSVQALCSAPTIAASLKSKTEGEEETRYINVSFTSADPKLFWVALREQLIRFGLQGACIVTCTGRDGWNDYLLLHHFDPQYRTGEARAL